MVDKKFTVEDLSNLLITLMNKSSKENKSSDAKNIESEKKDPKNTIENE